MSTRLSRKEAVALVVDTGDNRHVFYDEMGLLLVHAVPHGLDRGDFLSPVQAGRSSVHESLVKLAHRVLLQPLSLVDLQPTDYFVLQVFIHGPGRKRLLRLPASTELMGGAFPLVPKAHRR